MIVTVNGGARELNDSVTVGELVRELARDPDGRGVAVAIGGDVVRRGEWSERRLCDGDVVELLEASQGG